MIWNYEAILITLAQYLGGIASLAIIAAYMFWVMTFVNKFKVEENLISIEVFNAYKWKTIRIICIGFLLLGVLSAINTHRPKITATQNAPPINDSMVTQQTPEFKNTQTYREKLVEGVKNTDEQTQKTWDKLEGN